MRKRFGIVLPLLLGGCVNAFVPDAPIERIYPGFSTQSDVAGILGPPKRRKVAPSGDESWQYVAISLGSGSQGTAQFDFSGAVLSQCRVHATVGILGPSSAVRCSPY
jgi:hypothetical protein